VVLDKEMSSVRLVHKSLQDFLKKQHEENKLFVTGHCDIARACLVYLSCNDKDTTSFSSIASEWGEVYYELRYHNTDYGKNFFLPANIRFSNMPSTSGDNMQERKSTSTQ
jgi:hypothetical protein